MAILTKILFLYMTSVLLEASVFAQQYHGGPEQCNCNDQIEKLEKVIKCLQSVPPANCLVTHCAVGLKNGSIPNSDISASSVASAIGTPPHHGRLDYQGSWRWGWQARDPRQGEWIQVDLRTSTSVTGVVTQGCGNADYWLTAFKIAYGNSPNEWQVVEDESGNEKVFAGNSDRETYVLNKFPQPIDARYFRAVAHEWHDWGDVPNGAVSMRLEYVTC